MPPPPRFHSLLLTVLISAAFLQICSATGNDTDVYSLVFENPRLRQAYFALQAWKSAMTARFPAMTARFAATFRQYSGDNGRVWVFRQRQQQVVSATSGSGMFPATVAVFRRWRLGFRRGFRRDSGDGSRWIRRRLLVVLVYDLLKPSVVRKFFLWVLPLRRLPFLSSPISDLPKINEPEVGPARRARLDE